MTIVLDGRQGNVKSLPPAIGAVNTRCLIEEGCDACQDGKVDDGAPANFHPDAGNDINRYEIIGLRHRDIGSKPKKDINCTMKPVSAVKTLTRLLLPSLVWMSMLSVLIQIMTSISDPICLISFSTCAPVSGEGKTTINLRMSRSISREMMEAANSCSWLFPSTRTAHNFQMRCLQRSIIDTLTCPMWI